MPSLVLPAADGTPPSQDAASASILAASSNPLLAAAAGPAIFTASQIPSGMRLVTATASGPAVTEDALADYLIHAQQRAVRSVQAQHAQQGKDGASTRTMVLNPFTSVWGLGPELEDDKEKAVEGKAEQRGAAYKAELPRFLDRLSSMPADSGEPCVGTVLKKMACI
jgi:hypothetical protein